MQLLASAPGKFFLLGEYTVLKGAPALLWAAPARARVGLLPSMPATLPPSALALRVSADAVALDGSLWVAQGEGPFVLVENGGLAAGAAAQAAAYAFVGEVLQATLAVLRLVKPAILPWLFSPHNPLHLYLQTGDFFHNAPWLGPSTVPDPPPKLGLGSSAALTVALAAALLARADAQSALQEDALWRLCYEMHGSAQGGGVRRGSGADLAVALKGGPLCFFRPAGKSPQWAALPPWPSLALGLVLTPTAASTPKLLQAVLSHPGAEQAISQLAHASEAGLAAWGCDAAAFMAAVAASYRGLLQLGPQDLVVTPLHRQIADCCARLGANYKPAGAGGGDVGIVCQKLPLPADFWPALQGALQPLGARVVPCLGSAPGLQLH